MYKVKRFTDLTLSLAAIIILLPFLMLLALVIYINIGKPVIFTQKRVGKNGKIFNMYKFRTMLDKRDSTGNLLPDEQRITAFGKVLRSTSLDELPELINVIKGDMSFVGPRPLLEEYLKLYNKKHMERHNVLPGITGWAQVNGRNSISWFNKLELDVWYVDHWSLLLDFKILLITVRKVLVRDGINQEGKATVEKYNGFN